MVVYGDYTNSDTRSIIAVLSICGQNFQFVHLDVLTNSHEKNAAFEAVSPSKDFPVITEDNFILICSAVKNMNYLVATRPMIKKTLFPHDSHK